MVENNEYYKSLIKKHSGRSPILKNSAFAFIVGGFICFLGQWLFYFYSYLGIDEKNSYVLVTVTFIFISSLFTSLGFFDKIARHSGAGTLLPVTGFSNSVTSSAIDSKSEGYVLGVGAKMFSVAGPVIVFAILSSSVYGVIYNVFTSFWG
jgi:stage V sporulation protein AC